MSNDHPGLVDSAPAAPLLTFERTPATYQHWKLRFEGNVAYLSMTVAVDGGLCGDYQLKLNSYDIGVDIELADAVRRLRFEHPEVACVVLESGIAGVFCAGANIRMLAAASHAHKINFCKFTNETRLEIEDAAANSGLRFLAAVQGACSGGGYELAMACEHIVLVDDRASAVSLPEVPLLGVLPGTGGLTRLTDKRKVRRDRADVFALRSEGVRGKEAIEWGLVDELAPPSGFAAAVAIRAAAMAASSSRDTSAAPVVLEALARTLSPNDLSYQFIQVHIDRSSATAELTVVASPHDSWPLTAARELDDALCHLRFNEPLVATIVLKTLGDPSDVLVHTAGLAHPKDHAQRETALLWKRVLSRLDLMARSLFALIEPGSCFVGVLAELAFAADRSYMLEGVFTEMNENTSPATLQLTSLSFETFPMANGITRLGSRFWGHPEAVDAAHTTLDTPLQAADCQSLGLVTFTPDDLDWDDEIRLALEERASYSPDALSGMEAQHRFAGPETMATKIFGRLSAWQNWIFYRPNASGPEGALRKYGTGSRAAFDRNRT